MAFASAATRLSLLALLICGLLVGSAAPVAAAPTQAEKVIAVAKAQLKDPWKHYAKGPDKFDCVGFVWFAYNENGLKDKIGGSRGVGGYLKWFKNRGLTTRDMSKARPGDLIIWGRNQHVGIYLGDGMAVSALVNPYGVTVHKVKGYIGQRVKAFLRVDIER